MITCHADSEVDRFDGHCPVCHGDPDRCPTTVSNLITFASREGHATDPDGTVYRVEDRGTYPLHEDG